MEWFCSSKRTNYIYFVALHLYRSFMVWLYNLFVKPLENIVEKFLKHEPSETQWVHFYSLTTCSYISDFGVENFSFDSMETYLCPLTNYFDLFIQNEYDLLINHSVKQPKYDYEFEQVPKIMETLFVVRKDDKYVFRMFPCSFSANDNKELPLVIPEKSAIQFVIIEYKHPKMYDKIELKIPDSYYVEGNEILSPAFIQRMLQLQRSFYVFDFDYEVLVIDDDLECKKIHYNNYVKIEKTSYRICTMNEPPPVLEITSVSRPAKNEEELLEEEELEEEIEEELAPATIITPPPLSNTFVVVCCILMGSVLPLAQILNDRCRFIG